MDAGTGEVKICTDAVDALENWIGKTVRATVAQGITELYATAPTVKRVKLAKV